MQIGSGEYRLCGIDTNIYSDLLKEPRTYLPALTRLLSEAPTLLCFSPYTLYELRARPDLFAKFVSLFDLFPCAVLKNEEMLVAEETAAYETGDRIDPLLFGLSYLNKSRGTNLRNLIEVVFAKPTIAQRETEWPSLKGELLRKWIGLRENFPPKGRAYTLSEAKEFARRVTIQQVAEREPIFYRRMAESRKKVEASRFPSLMMSTLGVFFRLYEPVGRQPRPSDVFDVLISAPTPYLDIVVTEMMQCEIVRKTRRLMPSLSRVRMYSLRDVRNAALQPRNER